MEIDPAMLVAMMAAFVLAVLFLAPKGKKEEKVRGKALHHYPVRAV